MAAVTVSLGRTATIIDGGVFTTLLDESVMSEDPKYRAALASSRIKFADLVRLARRADIPYSLFFAPRAMVDRQMARKMGILLQGVSKDTFSMNTRGDVHLRDIELIVKDLLRKQQLLKKLDPKIPPNEVIDCLRGSGLSLAEDAKRLISALGIDRQQLKAARTKEAAYEYLVGCFEHHAVLVSQRAKNYMPQQIRRGVKFSGLCIKDKKVPFIFLNNKDEDDSFEPAGRRVLTLVLLGVCIARGRFSPVSYNEQAEEPITSREYQTAEEILLPAAEVGKLAVDSLQDVRAAADTYRVTPSAFLMRARRLGLVNPNDARDYLAVLRAEFAAATAPPRRTPRPITALRKYNGAEYSRRLLSQMDAGRLPASEVVRVLFQNKLKAADISDFRSVL